MRFDTNSQIWVDDNGQPLTIQPPKPNGSGMSNVTLNDSGGFPMNMDFNNVNPVGNFNFNNQNVNLSTSLPNNFQSPTSNGVGGYLDKNSLENLSNFIGSTNQLTNDFVNSDMSVQTPEQMYQQQTGNILSPNTPVQNTSNNSNSFGNLFSNMSRDYSLESSLYGLGSALGKKDYTGMTEQEIKRTKGNNTMSAIGNAGKLLLGGARTFMSGASSAHMNNWNINEYKNKRRDALVNNQTGVQNAYAAIGGVPQYQDGGQQVPLPPPISAELEGNPNTVYDFRNDSGTDSNSAIMSIMNGRPVTNSLQDYHFNDNVTSADVERASQLIAESRRAQSNNTSSSNSSSSTSSSKTSTNYDSLDFKTAFDKAYNEKGKGQVFTWKGKTYLLNKGSEPKRNNTTNVKTNNEVAKVDEVKKAPVVTKNGDVKKAPRMFPTSSELRALEIAEKEYGTARQNDDPFTEGFFDAMTFGIPKTVLGVSKLSASGGKDGKADTAVGLINALPLVGKLFTAPAQTIGILNGTNKATELMSGVNIANNATKTRIAEQLVQMAKVSKSPLTAKQLEMVSVAENFLKGTSGGVKELPGTGRIFGKKPDITELYLGLKAADATRKNKKYQDGGEVDDIMTQLQTAVQNGEMTEEEAQMYLQQNQEVQPQEQVPQEQDIQAQLSQAVQNGEMTEEEAMAYLQQSQQQVPQEQAQPEVSPEQAQEQLALAVQNGEMTEEEAQTYLQQLYGEKVNSQPLEPYTGEVRENIKPEEYLTGEYTTGDENKPHNAEVEKGEYINRDGLTQQVVGDKHSKGGEKMNLEAGTIIITDKNRIGASNAKALSLQTGLKLKAGDTYSQVIDIFTKKIGLEKLNKEQEELFKKLEKVGDQGNQTTQDLNNNFLNAKISTIEENKKQLLAQREQLVQVLFELQEQNKDNKSNTNEIEKFADGGTPDPCASLTGDARVQCVLKNYGAPKPLGKYGELETERQQILPFLQEMGVETPADLNTYNQQQLGQLAGKAQQATNDYVSSHYGLYEAPTQSGLQWLVDKGLLKGNENYLKDIYKNGKITRGSYDTLNEEGKKAVANIVEGLDPTNQAEYGKSSYRDNAWYYRNPIVRNVDFDNEDEYKKATSSYGDLGDGNHYYSGSKGLYFKFNLKTPEAVKPPKEGEKPVTTLSNVQGNKRRTGAFMLPDQSTLPPEGLRAVPKYDIRYNYLDNIRLSPEQNLTENYRAYDEARAKMEGLPDVMNQSNLAMLAGNVSQANNQAINQINGQNAQMSQQVAQANLGTLNRQAEMDVKFADQYDERMNKALDTTIKDQRGYYDFNRKVNLGEFNTRNQLNMVNDLFNYYGVGADGSVQFAPKTIAQFNVDQADAIKYRQLMEEQKKKNQSGTSSQKVVVKNKVSDSWGK